MNEAPRLGQRYSISPLESRHDRTAFTCGVEARGQGLGTYLLFDALARSFRKEIAWAAFLVDAKDEAAQRLYLQFDRLPLADDRLHLFALRGTVERLFGPLIRSQGSSGG